MINEVIVFTNGDSGKLSTWSNVPYFFTETLLAKGIQVHRVDLSPPGPVRTLYRRTVCQLVKLLNRRTSYDYSRSAIHFFLSRRKIKNALRRYPTAEATVFLTFSFSATGLSDKPSVQFCDWTYDHHVKHFAARTPDWFEKACIEREDSQIEGAQWVFPLFPSVTDYMKTRYRNKHIYYLGNVINSLYTVSEDRIVQDKQAACRLLFVGSRKYINGAICLVTAFERLRVRYPKLSLDIIGMTDADLTHKPASVTCYGYLDKDKPDDRKRYYALVQQATIFINTTPKWGAFSATIEAMYFYTPVIVSPYNEFVETFGREISFGTYCENEPERLANAISTVLDADTYTSLCHNAHTSVAPFTWSSYIDRMLETIEANQLTTV